MAGTPAAAQEGGRLPLWEAGFAAIGVSQLAYPGADTRVPRTLALPFLIYRGPWFRADEEQAGLRAFTSADRELDIGLAGSFGAGANQVPIREGMPNIGTLGEFGPRLKFWPWGRHGQLNWRFDLPIRGVFDASDGLAYRGLSIEPRVLMSYRAGHGRDLSISYGLLFGNRALAATWYGVEPRFATAQRAAYAARAGLVSQRLSLSMGKTFARRWRIGVFARYDHVGGAANEASPLVRARDGFTYGLNLSVIFHKSAQLAERP
ncbi:MAG: MipA/OmpV family protein [Burkholderiaceae bacterium]